MSRMTRPRSASSPAVLPSTTLLGWFEAECGRRDVSPQDPNFHKAVKPPKGHFLTTAPLPLHAAVADYDTTSDRRRLDYTLRCFFGGIGWTNLRRYQPLLLALIEKLDLRSPQPLPPVPGAVSLLIGEKQIAKINAMARYAATNVDQFHTVPPAGFYNYAKVKMWYRQQTAPESGEVATGGVAGLAGKSITRYTRTSLRSTRERVVAEQQAICTTFAAAAADLLMTGRQAPWVRVECVAGPNHCFCLLNRAESERDTTTERGVTYIPAAQYWGPGAVYVDAWAGALGHPVFYTNVGTTLPAVLKPYLGMALAQQFDSLRDK